MAILPVASVSVVCLRSVKRARNPLSLSVHQLCSEITRITHWLSAASRGREVRQEYFYAPLPALTAPCKCRVMLMAGLLISSPQKFSRYPERMPSSKAGRIPIPKEARHSIRLMVCLCSTEISDSLKWWAKGHISALKSKAAIKRHGWSSDITGAL